MTRSRRMLIVRTAVLAFALGLFVLVGGLTTAQTVLAQDGDLNPEVAITAPAVLSRLSWGAVIAGAIIALMIQLALNLLGVAIGATSINPNYDDDSASPSTIGRMAVIWIALSTLISLLAGGWLAARFAGIPNDLDGALHGLLVWGVVTLVSVLLLTTTIGRVISGTSTLIGHGLQLAGRAADAAARVGATAVAGAANVAGNVAGGVAHAATDAARTAGHAVQDAAVRVQDAAQDEIERHPEVTQALNQQNVSRQRIEDEVRQLLAQAGVPQERLQAEANEAAQQVRDAAQTAVRQAPQDPNAAIQTIMGALNNLFQRGRDVLSQADRDTVIDVIAQRANVNRAQAEQLLARWEGNFRQAADETDRVRNQVGTQLRQLQREAQHRVEDVQEDVRSRVNQARHEVEHTAREVAQATADAIAKLSAAVFAAVLIGAIAAGIGGALGAPEELPVAEIDTDADATSSIPSTTLFTLR